ncbi:MAG TPA: DUF192 domain-containing protein, partial [Victivallales bacterium]|nr:DUF192 domain-containing protein [Victivallales bacterium]
MIRNLTKKTIIAKKPIIATKFFQRGLGMIGKKFADFDAMIFYNCASIHTMFMTMKIDVIFVDRENRVCEIRKELDPWRPFVSSREAVTVIELPSRAIENSFTEKGDFIDLNAELKEEKEEKEEKAIIPFPDTAISISAEK